MKWLTIILGNRSRSTGWKTDLLGFRGHMFDNYFDSVEYITSDAGLRLNKIRLNNILTRL